MNRLLKAKHWQIFTMLIGIPFLIQIITVITTLSSKEHGVTLFIIPILTFLYMGIFMGWFWSIGTGLHDKLPEKGSVNLKKFKIIFAIPIVYFSIITIYMLIVAGGLIKSNHAPQFAMFDVIDTLLPVHILSVFSILYVMWINAKTIKSIEFQKTVKFSDFAGEFFLLWFFPIGIWIFQPRINKLAEK